MYNSDDLTEASNPKRPMSAEPLLRLAPVDMRQRKFATAMRGFDREEVTTFVHEAAGEYEQALRENERLRQDITRLEATLKQFRDVESSLKNTLVTAQKVADDMRENAVQDAARIEREAEGRAELLLQQTRAKTVDIEREIDCLRVKRLEAETNIEATIAVLTKTLEFIREQDGGGVEHGKRDSGVGVLDSAEFATHLES